MNNKEIQDYILSLNDDATIEQLKKLIDKEFTIIAESPSWGKMTTDCDLLEITNIKADIDIESGKLSGVMIYSDYYLENRKKFNAWTGLSNIKTYIKNERRVKV